jgi:hypothetical protein
MVRCGGIVVVLLAALTGCTNDYDGLLAGAAASGAGAASAASASASSGGASSSGGPGGGGGAGPASGSSSASTGGAGGSGPGGSGGTGGEAPCKLSELHDDFLGSMLEPTWEKTVTNNGDVQVHMNKLKVHPSGMGHSRAEIQSVDTYDFHDCSMHVMLSLAFSDEFPAASYMKALVDAGENTATWLRIGVSEGSIFFEVREGGNQAQSTFMSFDPEEHRWWRIRELAGHTYFETSSDKGTWTIQLDATTPGFATSVRANLGGSSYDSATADPGEAHFDDFNE